ncbi:hypothetical protein D9M71_398120 [compost metagenome]
MQQCLTGKAVQRRTLKHLQPLMTKCRQQPTCPGIGQPGAEKLDGLFHARRLLLHGIQQVQLLSAQLRLKPFVDKRGWLRLPDPNTAGQVAGSATGQRFQLLKALRAAQAQDHLSCLVVTLVISLQRSLKVAAVHGQAVAVAGLETTQGMLAGNPLQQGKLSLGLGIARPGDEFGMDHFTFAQLALLIENRAGEHVAQTLEAAGKRRLRDFEKVVGGALAGTGVDLAAMALHIAHQAVAEGKTLSAEKQQVLEKVRESRTSMRGVMTAGHDPHGSGTALQLRGMPQDDLQAIVEDEVLHSAGHDGSVAARTVMLADYPRSRGSPYSSGRRSCR